jgi:hypothetical protein
MRTAMFSLLAATLLAGAPMGFAYAQGVGGMGGGSDSIDPGAGAGGPPRAAGVSSAGGLQKGAIHPGRSDNLLTARSTDASAKTAHRHVGR